MQSAYLYGMRANLNNLYKINRIKGTSYKINFAYFFFRDSIIIGY